MSDLEPSVSYKPNDNSKVIAINETTTSNSVILNVDTIQKNLEELEKHDQIQPIRTSKLTIFNLTFNFIFNQIHFYVKIMTIGLLSSKMLTSMQKMSKRLTLAEQIDQAA